MGAFDKALKLGFVLSATDKMSRVIEEAVSKSSTKLSAFERNAAKVGGNMMKVGGIIAGAGAAIGAGILKVAKDTAAYGDEMWKTSQSVGVNMEDWQKLAYAAEYSNVGLTELSAGMVRLNKHMIEAANGSKTSSKIFTDLGIDIKDAEGNLRAPNDVFEELAEKMAAMPDGAQKTKHAYDMFGRSGANLIPLLNSGKEGIQAMSDEAERMGLVLSKEAGKACEEFNDNLARIGSGAEGLKMQFGAALVPMLDEIVVKINGVIEKVIGWVKNNGDLIRDIAKFAIEGVKALVFIGGLTTGLGGLVFAAGKVVGVIKAISAASSIGKGIASLLTPMGWVKVAIVAIAAAAYLIYKNWDKITAWFANLWDGVKQAFSAVWEWIKNMFLNYTPSGLIIKHWDAISGWFGRLWAGIKNGVRAGWEGIKSVFFNYTALGLVFKHWDAITGWFGRLWVGVKNGIRAGWEGIKSIFFNYTPFGLVLQHWEPITNWFSNLWGRVKQGVSDSWGSIKAWFIGLNPVEWIRNAWSAVGDFFGNLGIQFFEWGANLISSLWNGIKSIAGKAVEGIKEVGQGIATGFKSFLGINSPSRVFAEYGVNITQGLAGGIDAGGNAVERATEGMAVQATRGIGESIQNSTVNASSVSNVYGGNGGATVNYSPVINFNGPVNEETKQDFARMLRDNSRELIDIIDRHQRNKTRLSFG